MITSERELQSIQRLAHTLKVDKMLANTEYLSKENVDTLNLHFDNLIYWLKEEAEEYVRLCVAKQNQAAILRSEQNFKAAEIMAPFGVEVGPA